jgi:hypothetical protein
MNLNDNCGIDAFLIEPCPAVVQALYLLSLRFTSSAHQTGMSCIRRLDIFHFIKCFLTALSASEHFNKTTRILFCLLF